MKLKFLLVVLLSYIFNLGAYADDIEEVSFGLKSIKLTKNTWGEGEADLKILILYENSLGSTSVLDVGKNIKASLYEKLEINAGITVPINTNNHIAEVSIVILHERRNVELASLVLRAISNISNRKAIRELNKVSKSNWLSLVASGVLDISTDFAREQIIKYIKENEICRMIIQINKGENNWSHNKVESDENNNVRISYRTNFVEYQEESLWDKTISLSKEGISFVKQLVQHDTLVINNLMWQDEPYTKDEIKAYKDNKTYKKVSGRKNAIKYCKQLDLGGYKDWRLPSLTEIRELYENKSKLEHVETNILSSGYWTTDKEWYGVPIIYNFSSYTPITGASADSTYFIRCVRVK